MVMKQERTGKLKWMKELRETEWHLYIKQIFAQQLGYEWAEERLKTYREGMELAHDELQALCVLAKKNFDLKHGGEEKLHLQWMHRHCDNPECRTCYGKDTRHYPYPAISGAKSFDYQYLSTAEKEGETRIRRQALARFLVGECGFLETQVSLFFDLIDLRHLMIRRFNYEVEEYKNLGVL